MSKINKSEIFRVGLLSAMLCASGYAIAGAKTGSGASLGTNTTPGDIFLVAEATGDPMVVISAETRTYVETKLVALLPTNGAATTASMIMDSAIADQMDLNEVCAGIVFSNAPADQPAAAGGAIAKVPYADRIRASVMSWTATAVGAKAGVATELMNNLDATQQTRFAAAVRNSPELLALSPAEQLAVEAAVAAFVP